MSRSKSDASQANHFPVSEGRESQVSLRRLGAGSDGLDAPPLDSHSRTALEQPAPCPAMQPVVVRRFFTWDSPSPSSPRRIARDRASHIRFSQFMRAPRDPRHASLLCCSRLRVGTPAGEHGSFETRSAPFSSRAGQLGRVGCRVACSPRAETRSSRSSRAEVAGVEGCGVRRPAASGGQEYKLEYKLGCIQLITIQTNTTRITL